MGEMKEASAGPHQASLGDEIVGRINELAAISETPEHLTRIFLTKEHRAAADLILGWMRDALSPFGLPGHVGAAARTRAELLAYLELHIEQGPVLEGLNVPVGVVTAISGATRLAARLTGMAGHAGTVPMPLRRDALAGAAGSLFAREGIFPKRPNRAVGNRGENPPHPRPTHRLSGPGRFSNHDPGAFPPPTQRP